MNERETLLDQLLEACVEQDASDLHLAPDLPPYFRIHGVLEPSAQFPAVSSEQMTALADRLAVGFDKQSLERTGSLDGALTSAGARFRFNVFRRQGALGIALALVLTAVANAALSYFERRVGRWHALQQESA